MIALRLDQRLQARIDASDVIQEAYLAASARLAEYVERPTMPFFMWLRFLTGQRLLELHSSGVLVSEVFSFSCPETGLSRS